MKHFLALITLSLILTACSGGSNSGDNGHLNDNAKDVLSSCKNVITKELIQSYNDSQSEFRISSSGWDMRCRAEVTVNGRTTTVERNGHPNIRIYPRLQFLSIDKQENKTLLVHARVIPVTDDDVRKILKSIGVDPNENHLQYDEFKEFPFWARFGKGSLYYFDMRSQNSTPEGMEVFFALSAEDGEEAYLNQKLSDFTNNLNQIELMWRNDQVFYRQIFSATEKTASSWSNIEGHDILSSYVNKSEMAGTEAVLKTAIKWSLWWDLAPEKINKTLPELYSYADGKWINPNLSSSTIDSMVDYLKYIVKVNPNHSRKPILDTYNKIEKYYDYRLTAMQTTLDYLAGKLWSPVQFNQILSMADALYPKMSSKAWKLSETILKKTNYDQAKANFNAEVVFNLLDHGMVEARDTNTILSKTFSKIEAGLNPANTDIYFKVFDFLTKDYRTDSTTAEKTADQWVLSGHLTAQTFEVYKDFLSWLKDEGNLSYGEALAALTELTQKHSLDSTTVTLYKKCFSWLKDDLYIYRSDAFKRTNGYFAAEVLTEPVLTNLKNIENWYENEIYLNKTESLNRAENLNFKFKINQQQLALLKNVVNWLINDIYLNRSKAAETGESYLTNAKNPLTADSFKLFKDFANWLINDLYLNKTDALTKAETLLFSEGLTAIQINTLKQAANWLINDIYLNKTEALSKSELYTLKGHMTPQLLKALKNEYEKQFNTNKLSKTEALTKAENTVLGL
ncbi:MAG: hypothetical protein ACXVCP_03440 [Bdellovibrio sp.]